MTHTERRNAQVAEAITNKPGLTIGDLMYGVLAVRDAADAWNAVVELEAAGQITKTKEDDEPWHFFPVADK